jgi:hypothetical protein
MMMSQKMMDVGRRITIGGATSTRATALLMTYHALGHKGCSSICDLLMMGAAMVDDEVLMAVDRGRAISHSLVRHRVRQPQRRDDDG